MLLKSTGVPLLADIQHPNMAFDYTFNGDELHNLGDACYTNIFLVKQMYHFTKDIYQVADRSVGVYVSPCIEAHLKAQV